VSHILANTAAVMAAYRLLISSGFGTNSMPQAILIDSGPLIALFDRDDAYHRRMVAFLKDQPFRFVTTLAVITEVSHMLDFNIKVQIDFFEWVLRRGVILEDITQDDIPRIIMLIKKYQDLPMDFADASLVAIAQKTSLRSIISIDSDFDIYRLPGKLRIQNVFFG
jgi:predicted nucleic acid-binding protein